MGLSVHLAWNWEGSAFCLQERVAEYKAGLLRSPDHGQKPMALCSSKHLSPSLTYSHQESLNQKGSYFLFSIALAEVWRGLWFRFLSLVKFLKHSLMLHKSYFMKIEAKWFENEDIMIENSLLILTYAFQRGQAPTQERWQENYISLKCCLLSLSRRFYNGCSWAS